MICFVPRGVNRGYLCGGSARGRNPVNTVQVEIRGEEDHAGAVPCSPSPAGRVADRDRRSAHCRYLLQLASAEETYESALRRPEWKRSIICFRELTGRGTIERPNPQRALSC